VLGARVPGGPASGDPNLPDAGNQAPQVDHDVVAAWRKDAIADNGGEPLAPQCYNKTPSRAGQLDSKGVGEFSATGQRHRSPAIEELRVMKKSLGDAEARSSLRQRLQQCREIARWDEGEWNEAEVLVHALADLEESLEKLVKDLLPQVASNEVVGQELLGVLHEIGEEFRHVLYHVKDPKFYRYVTDDG
jgi:hypothetical protein